MLKECHLVSISLHLRAQLSYVIFKTPPGVERQSPTASGLCTYYKLGKPVGKEMRIHLLIVPTEVQSLSLDWPGFETMPVPTAVLWLA